MIQIHPDASTQQDDRDPSADLSDLVSSLATTPTTHRDAALAAALAAIGADPDALLVAELDALVASLDKSGTGAPRHNLKNRQAHKGSRRSCGLWLSSR